MHSFHGLSPSSLVNIHSISKESVDFLTTVGWDFTKYVKMWGTAGSMNASPAGGQSAIASATFLRSSRMGRRWGQTDSHLPQARQADARAFSSCLK